MKNKQHYYKSFYYKKNKEVDFLLSLVRLINFNKSINKNTETLFLINEKGEQVLKDRQINFIKLNNKYYSIDLKSLILSIDIANREVIDCGTVIYKKRKG